MPAISSLRSAVLHRLLTSDPAFALARRSHRLLSLGLKRSFFGYPRSVNLSAIRLTGCPPGSPDCDVMPVDGYIRFWLVALAALLVLAAIGTFLWRRRMAKKRAGVVPGGEQGNPKGAGRSQSQTGREHTTI